MDAFDVTAVTMRYGPMVLRRCRQLLRNEDEALDACQDVFVRILERQAHLHARYPSSLLYRVATNVCLNRIRDRGRKPETEDEDRLYRIAVADAVGPGTEPRLLLERLFRHHPASSHTIAVLHHVDGLTLDEVAEETGLSVSGVRKRLRRLRQTLVEIVNER